MHRAAPSRRLTFGLLASVVLLLACEPGGPTTPMTPRPSVLLVVVDTLRADRTSLVPGGPRLTPRLAALARRGTSYRQAVSAGAWTLPSMAALLSGATVASRRTEAHASLPSLAERFAAAGYRCVGLVANPLLAAENGFDRGFHEYTVASAPSAEELAAQTPREWDAEALVDRALELLADADERPLFLTVHLMDPHQPYATDHRRLAPPDPGWSAPSPDGVQPQAYRDDLSPDAVDLLCGWRRAYDSEVAFVDHHLGRLFDGLAPDGARPWLVALTADHGEGLFSHERAADAPAGPGVLGGGYADHGEQLFEEAVRVPLVLAGPGVPVGRLEDRAVSLVDLARTLTGLAGLPAESPRLPLADGDPVRPVLHGIGTRGWFARDQRWKLLVPFADRQAEPRLVAVSGAAIDAAAEREPPVPERAVVERLLRSWDAWRATDPEPDTATDAATEQRLRALGYLR